MTSSAPRSPHVAVDARMINDGGIGTYLRNVVPRIAKRQPDWRFTALGDRDKLTAAGWAQLANMSLVPAKSSIYGIAEQIELALRCPANADLYWAPHYNIPLLLSKRLAVTIHDVCHLAIPEMVGGIGRAYARFMLGRVRRHARAILFDSSFSRQEMQRFVGEPDGSAAIAHLAVDDDWYTARARWKDRPLPEPYLVYVGNMKRHKNVPMLLRAFRDVQARIPHRLVLIGRGEGLRADPEIASEMRTLDGRVVVAGEIATDQLQRYVAHADACLTASRYEGFGLPALEAMASGCACLVSRAGSLPEICGDAALYVDPHDQASIADGIVRIATDPGLRATLVAKGSERARQFSWDRCADETVSLLSRALQ